MMAAGLLTAPDGVTKIVGMLLAHCGAMAEGEAIAKPIKSFGPPVMDHMGPIPYCMQNSLLDAAFPKGALNYWKAQFLRNLPTTRSRRWSNAQERRPPRCARSSSSTSTVRRAASE
jgi:hypothetical protein